MSVEDLGPILEGGKRVDLIQKNVDGVDQVRGGEEVGVVQILERGAEVDQTRVKDTLLWLLITTQTDNEVDQIHERESAVVRILEIKNLLTEVVQDREEDEGVDQIQEKETNPVPNQDHQNTNIPNLHPGLEKDLHLGVEIPVDLDLHRQKKAEVALKVARKTGLSQELRQGKERGRNIVETPLGLYPRKLISMLVEVKVEHTLKVRKIDLHLQVGLMPERQRVELKRIGARLKKATSQYQEVQRKRVPKKNQRKRRRGLRLLKMKKRKTRRRQAPNGKRKRFRKKGRNQKRGKPELNHRTKMKMKKLRKENQERLNGTILLSLKKRIIARTKIKRKHRKYPKQRFRRRANRQSKRQNIQQESLSTLVTGQNQRFLKTAMTAMLFQMCCLVL